MLISVKVAVKIKIKREKEKQEKKKEEEEEVKRNRGSAARHTPFTRANGRILCLYLKSQNERTVKTNMA